MENPNALRPDLDSIIERIRAGQVSMPSNEEGPWEGLRVRPTYQSPGSINPVEVPFMTASADGPPNWNRFTIDDSMIRETTHKIDKAIKEVLEKYPPSYIEKIMLPAGVFVVMRYHFICFSRRSPNRMTTINYNGFPIEGYTGKKIEFVLKSSELETLGIQRLVKIKEKSNGK